MTGDGVAHAVTELRDAYGRNTGYTYAKAGTIKQTAGMSYDAETGRIATACFVHGGAEKTFTYGYLAGTSLLETLSCPSNLTITQSYESMRDLVTNITIKRGASTNVVLRNYTYDALGRPVTRSTSRNGGTQNDTFGYNNRSELTSATLGSDEYGYAFDNIGNRATSTETDTQRTYSSNNLNQYQAITETVDGQTSYIAPDYDADGNAVLIYTREVGGWVVTYNGANRPIKFENWATETTVECGYDSQGRRYFKKVTVAGEVTLHHRYIYRGYLQIACVDMTRSGHPDLWLTLWDPTQPTATRPLAIQKDGTWFTYGYDITKNVCEVFGPAGYIRTTYSYTPFGAVTESGDVSQPFQWSSEVYDSELGLVYYNYRHYSPTDGRFLSRDPIEEQGGRNLYAYVKNNPEFSYDAQGLTCSECRNAVSSVWGKLAPYIEVLDKLNNQNTGGKKNSPRKCHVNKPTCVSTDKPCLKNVATFTPCEFGGRFQKNAVGKITVFCGQKEDNFSNLEASIYHELFHAFQFCINELKKDSCEELMKVEIDAYCAQFNKYSSLSGDIRKAEIKKSVLASTVGGLCLENDMRLLFDRVFDERRCSEQKLPQTKGV